MEVVWAWALLDLPEEGFDEQLAFWREVTRTTVSPWRGEREEFATLRPVHGEPWVKVQRVGEPGGTVGLAGVHVDLEVDDIAGAAAVARDLGATVVDDLGTLVVCVSPGGFAFCLVQASATDRQRGVGQVREGQASLLDQVCLDIPADRYAAELTFWSRLTGWSPPRPAPEASGLLPLTRPPGLPVRLLTQRLGRSEGVVTGHVDLACSHRDADVRRHLELGARVESVHEHWTVLAAPGGRRYCLTDRDPRTGLLS